MTTYKCPSFEPLFEFCIRKFLSIDIVDAWVALCRAPPAGLLHRKGGEREALGNKDPAKSRQVSRINIPIYLSGSDPAAAGEAINRFGDFGNVVVTNRTDFLYRQSSN